MRFHSTRLLFPLGLLALGALTWAGLKQSGRPATWLEVEGPDAAVAGGVLPLRIRLRETLAPENQVLVVDLHWSTASRAWRGFLSGSTPQRADPAAGFLAFAPPVPPQPELGHVHAVIYVTPTGRWTDRIRVATTEMIPVPARATSPANAPVARRLLQLYDQRERPAAVREESRTWHFVTAGLWLVATAGWWWRHRQRASGTSGRQHSGRGSGFIIALACLTAATWELTPLEKFLGDFARSVARHNSWYEQRGWFQLALTSVLVMATAALVGLAWRCTRERARRLTWCGLCLYAGVALLSLLSLHEIDTLLATAFFSIPAVQGAELIAALLAVTGSGLRQSPSG